MDQLAMTLGESLLSAALSGLIDKAASSDLLKYARKENIDAEINKWHENLIMLNVVLADAEEKKTKSQAVKAWLIKLRALAYDVEDVLEEVNYEALRCKVTTESQAGSSSKKRSRIPFYCTRFIPRVILSNVKIGSKLEQITKRLEQIVKYKNDHLGLVENSNAKFEERQPTTSLVDQSRIHRRDDDRERIVQLLLGVEASSQLSVIPIIGIGGLGKTTLAQLVYNDDKVKAHFDLKAWVCVSDDFDIFKITKAIWHYVTSEPCNFDTIALLQEKLKEKLSTRKFLIVVDDLWNENVDNWESLCHPFRTGVVGCKLLVTTRNESVVSTLDATSVYRLGHLSREDSLSLFESYALGKETFDKLPTLKDIGSQIVEKCGQLPLAVKTLAGLLRNKRNLRDWEAVLKSDMWDLPGGQNKILPALKLSYHYLRAKLKCCFVYCSLFPKDYEFDKSELVSLWMAEGFFDQHGEKKEIEDLVCDYFDELLSRSFFQQSSVDDKKYMMHDLMNDLARSVAKEEKLYVWLDEEMDVGEAYNKEENVRHLSFVPSRYDILKRFKNISELKQLRTFLALRRGIKAENYLSYDVLHKILPEFKCLKVLSLYHYAISELPNNISDLKLLRHLDLSWSHITRLPDSVTALYNIQTLILYRCSHLVELPKEIKNLIKLHKLDLAYTGSLKEMPSGISSLSNLHTLSKFIVGKGDKHQIRELQGLTRLRGKLSIYGLDNVQDVKDVRSANLQGKEGLNDITLIWSDEFYDSRDEALEMKVLDLLEPNKNLKVLQIESYGGNHFSSWLGNHCFVNMERINLLQCKKSKSLPSLGELPLLKYLRIEGMDRVKKVDREFYGSKCFPNLETLELQNMLNWVDWSCFDDVEEFPKLGKLEINNCPSLKGNLPRKLPSLVELEIYSCPLLIGSRISLPSLVKMRMISCNVSVVRSMVDLNSLTTCFMCEISGLSYLDEVLMKSLTNVEDLQIQDCEELKCLWKNDQAANERSEEGVQTPRGLNLLRRLSVNRCEALETLPDLRTQKNSGNHHHQCLLEELEIRGCRRIRSLSRSNLPTTLKKLSISSCENLECLPDELMGIRGGCCHMEYLDISNCQSFKCFPPGKFPITLQTLCIDNNKHLLSSSEEEERFPKNIMLQDIWIRSANVVGLGLSCLKHLTKLTLQGCDDLVSFPDNVVFFMSTPNLKHLSIEMCKNLKLLPRKMHKLLSLQELSLWRCPDIIEFPEGGLPQKLTTLFLYDCKNLNSLPREMHNLLSLQSLDLSECPSIIEFPEGGLPQKLTTLLISRCKNLKLLPREMHNLLSLQSIKLIDCPSIIEFPEGGLPPNLTYLDVSNCSKLKQPISEWGLNTLTSLKELQLWGLMLSTDEIVSFLEKYGICILPSSLTRIIISDFKNMESISSSLQSLTSLQKLTFIHCPKLKSLPKETLPHSLGRLEIKYCPIGERCIKEERGGDYWPRIFHIPIIEIIPELSDQSDRRETNIYSGGCRLPLFNL